MPMFASTAPTIAVSMAMPMFANTAFAIAVTQLAVLHVFLALASLAVPTLAATEYSPMNYVTYLQLQIVSGFVNSSMSNASACKKINR